MTNTQRSIDLVRPGPLTGASVAALGTTVAVWAHPDDETYLAGGLLAALRDAGRRVVCVTATRGESADAAAGPRQRRELARLRTVELTAALDVLGIEEHRWLGYPDGGCAAADQDLATDRILQVISEVRPDTVVTFGPDGFTGHPDHIAVGGWADRAVAAAGHRPTLLHPVLTVADREAGRDIDERFGVYELGEPRVCAEDELAVRLVLSGAALARKVAALRCQYSQTGALIDALGADRYGRWIGAESFVSADG